MCVRIPIKYGAESWRQLAYFNLIIFDRKKGLQTCAPTHIKLAYSTVVLSIYKQKFKEKHL